MSPVFGVSGGCHACGYRFQRRALAANARRGSALTASSPRPGRRWRCCRLSSVRKIDISNTARTARDGVGPARRAARGCDYGTDRQCRSGRLSARAENPGLRWSLLRLRGRNCGGCHALRSLCSAGSRRAGPGLTGAVRRLRRRLRCASPSAIEFRTRSQETDMRWRRVASARALPAGNHRYCREGGSARATRNLRNLLSSSHWTLVVISIHVGTGQASWLSQNFVGVRGVG